MALPRAVGSEGVNSKKAITKGACKKFLKFLFSKVGLVLLVIVYSLIGGAIFQHLEEENEKMECVGLMNEYFPVEEKGTENLWEIAKAYVDEYERTTGQEQENLRLEAEQEIQKILHAYRDDVLELKYNGKNCTLMGEKGGPGHRWSFAGSLLFAVTVITTIGESRGQGWRGSGVRNPLKTELWS